MNWNVHALSLSARYSNGKIYDFNSGREITPPPPVSRAPEYDSENFEELPSVSVILEQHSQLFDIHDAELKRTDLSEQLRTKHTLARKYHAYAWHALSKYPDHPLSMILSGMAKGLGHQTLPENQ
jgi:hypothetical protein